MATGGGEIDSDRLMNNEESRVKRPAIEASSKNGSSEPGRGFTNSSTSNSFSSSSSSATQQEVPAPRKHLTVKNKTKIELRLNEIQEEALKRSSVYSVLRWIISIFLLVGVLGCLVLHKVSVVIIATSYGLKKINESFISGNATTQAPNLMADRVTMQSSALTKSHLIRKCTAGIPGDLSEFGCETSVIMMMIILIAPHGFALLRAIWCGGFRKDRPWPSVVSFFWCIVASLMESIAVALFVVDIIPNLPGYLSILILNGLFIVPIIMEMIFYCRNCITHCSYRRTANYQLLSDDNQTQGPTRGRLVCVILSFMCFIGAVVVMLFYAIKYGHNSDHVMWQIPLSILLLSAAWSPKMMQVQLQPSQKTLRKLLINSGDIAEEGDDAGDSSLSNPHGPEGESSGYRAINSEMMPLLVDDDDYVFRNPSHSSRWKTCIITSLLKIIFTIGFCILFSYVYDVVIFTRLGSGFTLLNIKHPYFVWFLIAICTSLFGYLFAWLACTMCMQIIGFLLPLVFTTPLSVVITVVGCVMPYHSSISLFDDCVKPGSVELVLMIIAAFCFYFSQLLSTSVFVWRTETIVMQRDTELFWQVGYHGLFLEQWLLLNRRMPRKTNSDGVSTANRSLAKDSRVYICTTMYREAAHEMEQLLRSIGRINYAKQIDNRHFQAHIFFDSGARGFRLTEFALQLICMVKKALDVRPQDATKISTPYGIQLTWLLPSFNQKTGMAFVVHFKDNMKVKNKKRWSQIMYMSYVLDYLMKADIGATEENSFILTTDADVKFNPESVEALLDLAIRNKSVGAVCARTHPMGSGPLVWYQMFDYAIGHWLQKATEDILGSVLCCPGCFSVYRVKAVREILPTYATTVTKASEFLVKDMGEDRWLCTLMVENGWRLEYCAAAECSTYCPEDFEEFFKQRRRWTPSTLANQYLLMAEWNIVTWFNSMMPLHFRIYEALLLFANLISPSVCVLVIAGGLQYSTKDAEQFNVPAAISVVVLTIIAFTIVCLKASEDTQLKVAKVLSTLFMLLMAAVIIGTVSQIVMDSTKHNSNSTEKFVDSVMAISSESYLPLPVSAIYLLTIIGIFILTALMHPTEFYCLFPGLLYLFTIPVSTIFLMIYSICNITDRSWGTREVKVASDAAANGNVWIKFQNLIQNIFFCCKKTDPTRDMPQQPQLQPQPQNRRMSTEAVLKKKMFEEHTEDSDPTFSGGRYSQNFLFHDDMVEYQPLTVRLWLPESFTSYAEKFENHGYDDTTFLTGISEKELQAIGIASKAHRAALLEAIKRLPDYELQPIVPTSISEWLSDIGLNQYEKNFKKSLIINPTDLQLMKRMSDEDFKADLKVTKAGHLRRLRMAVEKLRYPSEEDLEKADISNYISALTMCELKDINRGEWDFWNDLRQACLLPDLAGFVHDADLKEQLTDLRNKTLYAFGIVNAIWLILVSILVTKMELNVLGTNVLGLSFLIVFGVILIVQFLCMIVHRLATLIHFVARAPCRCGDPIQSNWSFSVSADNNEQIESDDREAEELRRRVKRQVSQRVQKKVEEKKKQRKPNVTTVRNERVETIEEESISNPSVVRPI